MLRTVHGDPSAPVPPIMIPNGLGSRPSATPSRPSGNVPGTLGA